MQQPLAIGRDIRVKTQRSLDHFGQITNNQGRSTGSLLAHVDHHLRTEFMVSIEMIGNMVHLASGELLHDSIGQTESGFRQFGQLGLWIALAEFAH